MLMSHIELNFEERFNDANKKLVYYKGKITQSINNDDVVGAKRYADLYNELLKEARILKKKLDALSEEIIKTPLEDLRKQYDYYSKMMEDSHEKGDESNTQKYMNLVGIVSAKIHEKRVAPVAKVLSPDEDDFAVIDVLQKKGVLAIWTAINIITGKTYLYLKKINSNEYMVYQYFKKTHGKTRKSRRISYFHNISKDESINRFSSEYIAGELYGNTKFIWKKEQRKD